VGVDAAQQEVDLAAVNLSPQEGELGLALGVGDVDVPGFRRAAALAAPAVAGAPSRRP